ncbi:hypothetical protein C7H62_0190 [Mesoflavibacter sp. HG96]|uniref:GIN domain-containing protein n=1 Tax=Mesoflavibacter TaxID=444051 RepID=UPI000D0F622D|nr:MULTISPECIES: DUF2807 domain-containing protein [Mesoflavibacter]QIJ88000.1 hypothetical protein C7H62_0190 [Mesoflavibacter sp. HG96]QIJ90728.1 hypothetical protein C7H56_0190 [Mesoflavibacter sp. HG37]
MNKFLLACILITTVTFSFAQKKEKVKGSRVLSTATTPVNAFNRLVLTEDFEVKLVKADSTSVKIVTDENLHDYIKIIAQDSTLTFKTTAKLQEKKLEITVFYNDALNTIEVKEDAEIFSSNSLKFNDLSLVTTDNAKAFLTLECQNIKHINDNKAKNELNITAKNVTLELGENSKLEALINASNLEVDLLVSADAELEGDVQELELNADNSSDFIANNLTVKTINATTLNRAKVKVNATKTLNINASGTSEIEIFGSPKINIDAFEDNAILKKK